MTGHAVTVRMFSPHAYSLIRGQGTGFGGAEIDLWNVARELACSPDIKVEVLSYGPPGLSEFVSEGVRVMVLPWKALDFASVPPPSVGRLEMVRHYWRLLRSMLRCDAHVVYAKLVSVDAIVVYFGSRLRRIPIAFRIANDSETSLDTLRRDFFGSSWLLSRLFYRCLRRMDLVICQKETQAAALRRNTGMLAPVIPNAHVIPDSLHAIGPGARKGVLWVGRTLETKNPLGFLEIAERLPHIPFTMVLAGSDTPNARQQMDAVTGRAAALPNVTLLPGASQDELTHMYGKARAFVLTSTWEGFPNVVVEALKYGVPVVSTRLDLDGLLPLVHSEEPTLPGPSLGLCVGNDLDLAARLVDRLTEDDDYWVACSRAAREYAKSRFDVKAIAGQYKELFRRLADRG